jgi:predicted MFS family arabinose efflux permease
MFFFDFGVSIYFFFFNLFLSGHGYSEAQMGLLTGTMAAGNLAGAIPAAALIRRKGLRYALVVCLVAAPTVLCVRSLSPFFPIQVALAFLTGLSLCLWAVVISPITAALTTERERPLAFSLVFSLGIGVGAVGALAGSRMPGLFSRAVGDAAVLAPDQLTLISACCIAAFALIPATRLRRCGSVLPPRPGSLSTPAVRRILPAVGIWGLVTGSFAPFGNVFLATHVRLSLHNVGMVFSMSQLCQVAAVLCAPLVFRRIGVPKGVFTMQMATATCFMLLALTIHPIAAGTVYVALMGMQYMGEPGIYSMMMNVVPEEARGGASASMALVLGAAQLIAAACAGWAFTTLGYPRTLGIIAMIAVIAGLLFRTVRQAETPALVPCVDEVQGK